ncbi:hypothetical protein [Saccharothrix luteola]|uniref:hypothetical protein n=1 Tax=Saccharothrix luteola TaxID=2893018 RepID=UPI001E53FC30|nr:hypothetical protein [Saccharothrix luteola]MCC8244750.1 hypothetical protein [Saccharothrix luteola]
MEYRWRYQDDHGREIDGPVVAFPDQNAAEDWFSTAWVELREAGVAQVTLLRSESEVYGPMSLAPAE